MAASARIVSVKVAVGDLGISRWWQRDEQSRAGVVSSGGGRKGRGCTHLRLENTVIAAPDTTIDPRTLLLGTS